MNLRIKMAHSTNYAEVVGVDEQKTPAPPYSTYRLELRDIHGRNYPIMINLEAIFQFPFQSWDIRL